MNKYKESVEIKKAEKRILTGLNNQKIKLSKVGGTYRMKHDIKMPKK